MIRLLAIDIDGVLTDGKIYSGDVEREMKSLCFKDFDTLSDLRYNEIKLAIITGEDNSFTNLVEEKFAPIFMYKGCKNKLEAVKKIAEDGGYSLSEIAYIGDGKYDVETLKNVGLSFAPSDSITDARKSADIVLECSAGEGCLRQAFDHVLEYNRKQRVDCQINALNELNEIDSILGLHIELVNKVLTDNNLKRAIGDCVEVITDCFSNGGQLLLCGNGGSAADAQHIATEFVSRFYMERRALNAEALTVNTSSITAIANDYDYDKVFARQMEAKGKEGDVIIGISTSGTSKNVIKALESARGLGIRTIAFVGMKNKLASEYADIVVSVPSECTPRIQEMHIMIGHIVCEQVEKRLFG